MAKRIQNLFDGPAPTQPKHSNARAKTIARQLPAHQIGLAQSRVLGSSSRVLADCSMGNADSWATPDTAGDAVLFTHFDKDTGRTVLRAERVPLTPGCLVGVSILSVASGDTQDVTQAGLGAAQSDGASGAVTVQAIYRNGGNSRTRTVTIELPASDEANGAQPQGAGACIDEMRVDGVILVPAGFFDSVLIANTYSKAGTTVDLQAEYLGGARVVDLCFYEVPQLLVFDDGDEAPASSVYTDADGEPLTEYPESFPVEVADSGAGGDPRLGTQMMLSAAQRLAELLGPAVFSWTSYGEHLATVNEVQSAGAGTGDDEYPAVSFTGATPSLLWDPSITAQWSATTPAATIAVGGHGRLFRTSGPEALDDEVGVARVVVRAYAAVENGGDTGYIRVGSNKWSYADMVFTSTSFEWVAIELHVECGRGPLDTMQLWAYPFADGALEGINVRDLHVHFLPDESRGEV